MKDLNNGIDSSVQNERDDCHNKDSNNTVTENVQDNQNVEAGEYENTEKLEIKEEDNAHEKEEPCEQAKAASEESESHQAETDRYSEQVRSDEAIKGCSSYYKPPYYIPNFTIEENAHQNHVPNERITFEENQRQKASFSLKMLVMLSAVLLCVLASFVLGALSGKILPVLNNGGNNTVDLKNESITVVKNSPKLDVVENMPEDYVPQTLPEVVQKVGNSVVEISTSSVVTDRFYGQYVTSGAGSGVIITQNDTAGYLLTNHHVIENAKTITVRLTNKDEYEATVLGSNRQLDLAVIRIEKKLDETFTVTPIGDSSKLIVGQDVIAIGNPLGSLGGTVTDGIVSALDRNVSIDGVSMTLLQHNAAINPGNSGGALFDMMGNLIGIVNAKTSDTGIEGLGFAIPVNIAFEYFKGVMQACSIGATVDYGYNSERIYGVYVVKADDNSKFQRLDRIIAINDTQIKDLNDYYSCIDDFKMGDIIKITVVRNKAEIVLEITLS